MAGRLTCHAVSVPQHPSNPHAQLCVGAAMDERGRLWLQVDCLTWLAEYIKAEKESGGVAPLEESEEAEPRVQWNFQHSSWQALAVSPDGTKERRERCVKARQKAGGMNFVEAKETLYRETLEWLAAVEGGMPPPRWSLSSAAAMDGSVACDDPRWWSQCTTPHVYCGHLLHSVVVQCCLGPRV